VMEKLINWLNNSGFKAHRENDYEIEFLIVDTLKFGLSINISKSKFEGTPYIDIDICGVHLYYTEYSIHELKCLLTAFKIPYTEPITTKQTHHYGC